MIYDTAFLVTVLALVVFFAFVAGMIFQRLLHHDDWDVEEREAEIDYLEDLFDE